MKKTTIGFIGSGNMGGAMIGGIIAANLVPCTQIIACDPNQENLRILKEKYQITTTSDNLEAAKQSDILFLAVKPNLYPYIIKEIKNKISDHTIIVTIAAGQSITYVENLFGKSIKLVRSMPNTPALVSEGMSALCSNENVSSEELEQVELIFNSFGHCEIIPESLMDTVTGVSGSSPAYVYILIEAMADAAVKDGMPRPQAYRFAAQAVLGSAKMVLDTNTHPGALKDMVCSPGGTTIEAVSVLEREGFRNAIISAQGACVKKSKKMTR